MPVNSLAQIHTLLDPDRIRVGLKASSKEEALHELVDLLEGSDAIGDLDAVRTAVAEREQIMSTGVGKGLALPHAKTDAVSDTTAGFAVAEEPIAFDAIDGKPVRLFFLLVGPKEARSTHIKILSRISRLLNRDEFRTRLLEATTPREVIEIFKEGEAKLNG